MPITVDADASPSSEPLLNVHFHEGALSVMHTLTLAEATDLVQQISRKAVEATRNAGVVRLARAQAGHQ